MTFWRLSWIWGKCFRMDKTLKYQEIILQLLDTWKGYKISNRPNLTIDIIINKAISNFIALNYDWDDDNYIYNVLFHIELKNDNNLATRRLDRRWYC